MSVDVTKMPKLGFGMMRLPEKDGELDLEQICKMVDAYLASGMNYFDTAYMYCGGKSESIVKKALVERHPRESFTLTTKLPQWMMDEGIEGRDRIFNDQLARTGAGYFDYYLLHSVEDGANYEGYVKYDCFNWAKKKKEEGLIKHFGFSFHESFVLALYALCASLEPGTGKQKSPCNSIAEAFEITCISAFKRAL